MRPVKFDNSISGPTNFNWIFYILWGQIAYFTEAIVSAVADGATLDNLVTSTLLLLSQ